MATDVNFNLQQFLHDMRSEMLDGFDRVDATAAKVRGDLVEHEKHDIIVAAETNRRLDRIDDTQSKFMAGMWWTIRTIVAAILVGGIGLAFAAWK